MTRLPTSSPSHERQQKSLEIRGEHSPDLEQFARHLFDREGDDIIVIMVTISRQSVAEANCGMVYAFGSSSASDQLKMNDEPRPMKNRTRGANAHLRMKAIWQVQGFS